MGYINIFSQVKYKKTDNCPISYLTRGPGNPATSAYSGKCFTRDCTVINSHTVLPPLTFNICPSGLQAAIEQTK